MSPMISFKRPDGKECAGFFVDTKAGEKAPGVVVIQEWWGLNDQIKGVANRLSSAGYRTLVPDLYRGKLGLDATEAEHLMSNLDFADAAAQDLRGAIQYLKRTGSEAAVMGFCMGGALTILTVANVPEVDAGVCWYGCPPLEYVDASKIRAPLIGHFATQDAFFPPEQIEGLEAKLKAAGVKYEFYRYQAQHAFANETIKDPPIPIKYDQPSADLAWRRTMEFLKRNVG
jgi:carboxymethylenebutenolidase